MRENRNNKDDLMPELEDLHPRLKNYAGKSGFEVPVEKMEQMADNFANTPYLKRKKTRTYLISTRWMRAAAAVVITISIALSVYLVSDSPESHQPLTTQEDMELYFDFLHREVETLERDFFIESLGEIYLDAVSDGNIYLENYNELYYFEDIEFIY